MKSTLPVVELKAADACALLPGEPVVVELTLAELIALLLTVGSPLASKDKFLLALVVAFGIVKSAVVDSHGGAFNTLCIFSALSPSFIKVVSKSSSNDTAVIEPPA